MPKMDFDVKLRTILQKIVELNRMIGDSDLSWITQRHYYYKLPPRINATKADLIRQRLKHLIGLCKKYDQ